MILEDFLLIYFNITCNIPFVVLSTLTTLTQAWCHY